MLRIGLTGGIASGKSTVANLFRKRGVPIVDTDDIARQLVEPGSAAVRAIAARFGESVLTEEGALDRTRLRERVFTNPAERQALESILHPGIRGEVERRVAALGAPYCLIVVPLLIETDFAELVDRVLVVDATEEQQRQRVDGRGLGSRIVNEIMARQTSRADRLARADDVIDNTKDLALLDDAVEQLHRLYTDLAAQRPG